jgi:hypothetical protein
MQKKWETILKTYLIFGGLYMIGDALIHIMDFRLVNVEGIWPQSAVIYGKFMGHIYGAFVLCLAIFSFEVRRDIQKYRKIIYAGAIWSIFYGLFLIYTGLSTDLMGNFRAFPSLYMWLSFYNYVLVFEGLILVIYSIIVYCWSSFKE